MRTHYSDTHDGWLLELFEQKTDPFGNVYYQSLTVVNLNGLNESAVIGTVLLAMYEHTVTELTNAAKQNTQ